MTTPRILTAAEVADLLDGYDHSLLTADAKREIGELCDSHEALRAERDALVKRLERLERVVGLAHRFVMALGGAKLRQRDFDTLDPLLAAMNALPMADLARCLDALAAYDKAAK